MEVRVEKFQLPETLRFNYEELKQELEAKVSHYETLVYTDEQISEAKADRANLNKLKKALNDERIRMEREYMIPFNEFKDKINEIISIIERPVAVIDKQVKEYEEERKRRKLEEITEYKKGVEASLPAGIVIPVDDKWLNASVSIAKVKEAIDEKAAQIEKDILTLDDLPEFSFEAVEVYKTTLDLNRAISEGHRLSEIAKRKAEHEAEQARLKAEAEAAAKAQAEKDIEEFENGLSATNEAILKGCEATAQGKQWIGFKALLTVEQAKELKAFFESRQIEFQSI